MENQKSIDKILRYRTHNPVYNIPTLAMLHKKTGDFLEIQPKICEIELKCWKSTEND